MIGRLNVLSGEIFYHFQQLALQNTIFLALVLLLLFFFRRKSARFLSLIALIGIFKLILPPIFNLEIPLLNGVVLTPENTISNGIFLSGETVNHLDFFSLRAMILITWATISLVLLIVPIIKTIRLWRRFSNATPLDMSGVAPVMRDSVAFVKSEQSHSPLVIGFFKPRVVVPKDWDSWSRECQRVVLAHEVAHIKNGDQWIRLIQLMVNALHFFNPLVYLLNRQLTYFREIVCDDAAVSAIKGSPVDYTRYLVKISELVVAQRYTFALSATFSQSGVAIKKRISYQLQDKDKRRDSKLLISFVVIALLSVMIPLSSSFETGASRASAQVLDGVGLVDLTSDTPDKPLCIVYDENGNRVDPEVKMLPTRLEPKTIPIKPIQVVGLAKSP